MVNGQNTVGKGGREEEIGGEMKRRGRRRGEEKRKEKKRKTRSNRGKAVERADGRVLERGTRARSPLVAQRH